MIFCRSVKKIRRLYELWSVDILGSIHCVVPEWVVDKPRNASVACDVVSLR